MPVSNLKVSTSYLKRGAGILKFKIRVWASGVVQSFTYCVKYELYDSLLLVNWPLKVKTTSSDVRGWPSLQAAIGLSLMVSWVKSALYVMLSASHGISLLAKMP